MALATCPATTVPPAKTMGLKAFCPYDRKPRPVAKSECVATRYSFLLDMRQRDRVARNNRHIHRNKRKRKKGALIKLNHQPAMLSSPAPMPAVCQLEVPLINSSVLTTKIDGKKAATSNKSSGTTRSRKRLIFSNSASKSETSVSATSYRDYSVTAMQPSLRLTVRL